MDEKKIQEFSDVAEEIDLSGLVEFSPALIAKEDLTILGTRDMKIETGTLCVSDDGSIYAIQESGSEN